MAVNATPLLADDGAYLRVRFEPGEHGRVTLHCVVQIDRGDMTQREQYSSQYCANIEVARDFARDDIAGPRGLPILWEGSTFEAEVYHNGNGWLGRWTIRYVGFPLEENATIYPTEETARYTVVADAQNHFHGHHIGWTKQPAPII